MLDNENSFKSFETPGQVITFYSYKGGTGRTMALANIACLLAKDEQLIQSKGILMIDWDLEAPGLHSYFCNLFVRHYGSYKNLDSIINEKPGLIDLFIELVKMIPETDDPYKGQSEEEARQTLEKIDFDRFILKTDEPSLFLMKAGKFDENYSKLVNEFDWENLYIRSPHLMRIIAETLSERFQYVLIDSRTGQTDISNICTMLMPEKLVVVFTPNNQSITGIKHLVEQAVEYREQSSDSRTLMVYPLASRIDVSQSRLEKIWRYGDTQKSIKGYQPLFEGLFKKAYRLNKCNMESYFDEIKIHHVADYAYGEEIAALIEKRTERLSLANSYSNFVEYLLKYTVPWKGNTVSETEEKNKSKTSFSDSEIIMKNIKVFISYTTKDFKIADRLYNDLKKAGVNPWLDRYDLLPGQKWKIAIRKAMEESNYYIILLSSRAVNKRGFIQKEMRMALDILDEYPDSESYIIPVRLDDCELVDQRLEELHWVDLEASYDDGLNQLLRVFAQS